MTIGAHTKGKIFRPLIAFYDIHFFSLDITFRVFDFPQFISVLKSCMNKYACGLKISFDLFINSSFKNPDTDSTSFF